MRGVCVYTSAVSPRAHVLCRGFLRVRLTPSAGHRVRRRAVPWSLGATSQSEHAPRNSMLTPSTSSSRECLRLGVGHLVAARGSQLLLALRGSGAVTAPKGRTRPCPHRCTRLRWAWWLWSTCWRHCAAVILGGRSCKATATTASARGCSARGRRGLARDAAATASDPRWRWCDR